MFGSAAFYLPHPRPPPHATVGLKEGYSKEKLLSFASDLRDIVGSDAKDEDLYTSLEKSRFSVSGAATVYYERSEFFLSWRTRTGTATKTRLFAPLAFSLYATI